MFNINYASVRDGILVVAPRIVNALAVARL